MNQKPTRQVVSSIFAALSSFLALLATWFAYDIGKYMAAALAFFAALTAAYIAYKRYKEPLPFAESENEYAKTIARVEEIKSSISDLSEFLERERQRVVSVEATVIELNKQKKELEPIVSTHKETVDAILSAYAKQTARNLWMERIILFVLGVVASVVASGIFDAMK